MKINLLSSKIYNRIAAGEVVERPFSVVKELVENSIDAGADCISIDIENGGISSIEITDNGFGIEKCELKKALLPHATSKISSVDDLDNIQTLGFRGEALASIASVSKISILSKPKTQDFGAKISADGGLNPIVEDSPAVDGTVITVRNLFYNTPVREKFLHTPRAEEGEISNTVARFILSHPQIAFKYTADGKTVYQSYGDGFDSAMACVYGVDVIDNCFKVDTEKNGIKIKGYISKHNFTKGNRSYQTTFVNDRYVINQTISSSIMNAYSSYLMKRQYPFFVLSFSIPSEIVDVNVHPRKLEVRFSNNQIIYGSIYSVISKILDGSTEVFNVLSKQENKQLNTIENNADYVKHNEKIETKPIISKWEKLVFNDSGVEPISFNSKKIEEKEPAVDIFAENKLFLEKLEKEKAEREKISQQEVKINRELKLIGQALNTFLVLEDGVDLYFIDQHAAHERILFDKFNEALKTEKIVEQPLLLPFILNVNNVEYDFILSKMSVLRSMGIDIGEFGRNAFKISALPSFLTEMNLQKFFDEILTDLNTMRSFTVNDLLIEKIAQKACKAAIKSGDKLSDGEIEILIEKIKDNLGLKCPHGRPVVVKITRMEIDKWFKRIV